MIEDNVEDLANVPLSVSVISDPASEICICFNLRLDPNHIEQHPKAHANYYGAAIEFHVKACLVTDPFKHYADCGSAPWSREEIEVFLGRWLTESKNLAEVSTFLPHKTVEQVVQFYYDVKVFFGLKECYNFFHNKKGRWGKKLVYPTTQVANKAKMKVHVSANM